MENLDGEKTTTTSGQIIAMEINNTADGIDQRSNSRSQSPGDNRRSKVEISSAPGAPREGSASIEPTNILGVFGLHPRTTEAEIENLFSPYGTIKQTVLIGDKRSGQSRGFGFVYFETVEEATAALTKTNGTLLDGRSIRVDYSATNGPHEATPGQYMGKRTYSNNRYSQLSFCIFVFF